MAGFIEFSLTRAGLRPALAFGGVVVIHPASKGWVVKKFLYKVVITPDASQPAPRHKAEDHGFIIFRCYQVKESVKT